MMKSLDLKALENLYYSRVKNDIDSVHKSQTYLKHHLMFCFLNFPVLTNLHVW